jgi:hypothetical protein
MYSQIRIFLSEFKTNLCFSDAPHSVQQERLSVIESIGFSIEEGSKFRVVLPLPLLSRVRIRVDLGLRFFLLRLDSSIDPFPQDPLAFFLGLSQPHFFRLLLHMESGERGLHFSDLTVVEGCETLGIHGCAIYLAHRGIGIGW